MKKITSLLILLLMSLCIFAQQQRYVGNTGDFKDSMRVGSYKWIKSFTDDTLERMDKYQVMSEFSVKTWVKRYIASGGGTNLNFDGNRPITAPVSGFYGLIPGTTDIKGFLNAVFYPSQGPTASLSVTYAGNTSGGIVLEKMASGADLSVTLNWQAGRQGSTATLQTITVDGVVQTFTQPDPGSSVSGTKASTVQRNVDKSYSMSVSTTDGKSASAGASVSFLWKRYWGFVSSTSPNDAAIQALTNEFLSSRTRGNTNAIAPTGSQYFVIAFPESFDVSNVTQIWIGGLDQTAAFNRSVRSFTNASGGVTNYIVYVTKNLQSGSVSYNLQ